MTTAVPAVTEIAMSAMSLSCVSICPLGPGTRASVLLRGSAVSSKQGNWWLKKYGHRGLLGTHTKRYTVCLTTMHNKAVRSSDGNALGLAPKVESGIQLLFWEGPRPHSTNSRVRFLRPQVQALVYFGWRKALRGTPEITCASFEGSYRGLHSSSRR